MPTRRTASFLVLCLLTAGCGFLPGVATPIPSTGPSSATSLAPSPASPAPSRTAQPSVPGTPGEESVPRFAVGSLATTNAPGLRVRSRPGTDQRVVTTLGLDSELLVGLGPILVDGLGWYLVRDADDADPEFSEGWVAAGFEPDPFLISAGFAPDDTPFVAGFADTASGEFGPVAPPNRGMTLRWIAATHRRDVCNFSLDVSGESGDAVRAVRTPVGAFPASGELPAEFFAGNDLRDGPVFAAVQSDCSWAISFVRVPRATPSPS